MTKKVIALTLATLMLVLSFSACGNKIKVESNAGEEYEAVTDENGDAQFNNQGNVIAYDKDENGKHHKDENGEYETVAILDANAVKDGLKYQTSKYNFVLDLEGWSLSDHGEFIKDDTDGKVFIKIVEIPMSSPDFTIDAHLEKMKKDNEPVIEELRKTYPDTEMLVSQVELLADKIPATVVEFKIPDADGKMMHYAHGTYFMWKNEPYKIEYVCTDANSYSAEFNMVEIINQGLTLK